MRQSPTGPGPEGAGEKRRRILSAAARTFAERGYHGCRISDVAREAGVAYGLVYHYFQNKEALLTSVFEESWGLFHALVQAAAVRPGPLGDKLDQIVGVALEAYRAHPHAVRVMVIEVARSPFFLERRRLEAFEDTFRVTARIIEEAQARGEARRDVDPLHGAYLVFGAIEMILTGFVLGSLDPDDEARFAAARADAVRVLESGLTAGCEAPREGEA